MNKKIALFAGIVVLGVGAYYAIGSRESDEITNTNMHEGNSNVSGMRAEENMVVIMEQKPGTTVIGSIVFLAEPGYLVIHEDASGDPGAIIGSSILLPAGENTGVTVTLARASRNGETLHAMLHFEKGGNASFIATDDTPVPSILGGAIHGTFEISAGAPTDIPIVL